MIDVASRHQIFPGLVTIWYPITLRSSKTENILSLLVLWYSPPTHHCNGFLSYFSSVFLVVYLLHVPIWRVNIFSMKLFTVSVESAKFPLRGLSYRYHYKTLTVVEVTWQGPKDYITSYVPIDVIVGKATSSFRKTIINSSRTKKFIFARTLVSSPGRSEVCLPTFFIRNVFYQRYHAFPHRWANCNSALKFYQTPKRFLIMAFNKVCNNGECRFVLKYVYKCICKWV